MDLGFEWDPKKAVANERKHKVSFEEASSVFADPLATTIFDPLHSDDEDRFVSIGISGKGRLVVVNFTDRGERIRIISARVASKQERKQYEEDS